MYAKTFYSILIPSIGLVLLLAGQQLGAPELFGAVFGPVIVGWFVLYACAARLTEQIMLKNNQYHLRQSVFVTKPWRAYGLGALCAPFWALAIIFGGIS